MTTVAQTITAQQLFETPGLERFELVGEDSYRCRHRDSIMDASLGRFTRPCENSSGPEDFGSVAVEAGFCVSHDPDTVRSPDVAFVRAERIPPGGVRAFFDGAPDLAVEVVSPSDRASEVIAKARDWLRAGCTAVWVVDPETQTATVYSHRPQTLFLSTENALCCEELLPGFRLPLSQVFNN